MQFLHLFVLVLSSLLVTDSAAKMCARPYAAVDVGSTWCIGVEGHNDTREGGTDDGVGRDVGLGTSRAMRVGRAAAAATRDEPCTSSSLMWVRPASPASTSTARSVDVNKAARSVSPLPAAPVPVPVPVPVPGVLGVRPCAATCVDTHVRGGR